MSEWVWTHIRMFSPERSTVSSAGKSCAPIFLGGSFFRISHLINRSTCRHSMSVFRLTLTRILLEYSKTVVINRAIMEFPQVQELRGTVRQDIWGIFISKNLKKNSAFKQKSVFFHHCQYQTNLYWFFCSAIHRRPEIIFHLLFLLQSEQIPSHNSYVLKAEVDSFLGVWFWVFFGVCAVSDPP